MSKDHHAALQQALQASYQRAVYDVEKARERLHEAEAAMRAAHRKLSKHRSYEAEMGVK